MAVAGAPPLSLRAYAVFTRCLGPMVNNHLSRRVVKGKEEPGRLGERFGTTERRRPKGALIWIHAASVGETLSVLPLVKRLTGSYALSVMVTSGTVTSARLMQERLPGSAFHQYIPLDHPTYVSRFLDHWQPDVAVWVESELWPNLIHQTKRRQIPALLVNARMSENASRKWEYVPGLSRYLLQSFSSCFAQDDVSAQRLTSAGALNVQVLGNLKLASPALPFDDAERSRLESETIGRRVWVAASIHPGEDEIIIDAHRRIAVSQPDVLTIIVPRHPERGDAIEGLLSSSGLGYARRGRQEPLDAGKAVYLADTLGELGLIYALASIAFVGGSLVPHGGQNPLEPARSDCAVLLGPHTDNFASIVEELLKSGAAGAVSDAQGLATKVIDLFANEERRKLMAQKALKIATAATKIQDDIVDAILRHLPTPQDAERKAI